MRQRPTPIAVVFLGLAGFSTAGAVTAVEHLASHGGAGRALVAGYTILRAVIAVAFAAFVVVRGPARRRVREPRALLTCTIAMSALVAMRPPSASSVNALTVAGEGLVVLGSCLLLASALTLGRCFGILPEARGLVTRGPYRRVRHPIYLGELAAAAGLLLAAPTVVNAVLALAFAWAQAARMGMEERELGLAFPEYAGYAERTPRLVPRFRAEQARPVQTTITNGELA